MNKPITLCDRCKEYTRCCLSYDGNNCRRSRTVEPTNADRIRSMTDEELAVFITRNIGLSTEAWLDWLQENNVSHFLI